MSKQKERIKELEREVAELRRALQTARQEREVAIGALQYGFGRFTLREKAVEP